LGVNHAAKDVRSCSIRTAPPLNKTDAYNSVRLLEYFPSITVADVNATRFYCDTKWVVRSLFAAPSAHVQPRGGRGEADVASPRCLRPDPDDWHVAPTFCALFVAARTPESPTGGPTTPSSVKLP
jgi:hypothetical protein